MNSRCALLPALLAALLALSACGRGPAAPLAATAATVVGAVRVSAGPDLPALQLHGVIASRDEARLSFKVAGVIARISVEAGESVHAGQVLAEIEPTEIDAQLRTARELDAKATRDLERGENLYRDEVISLEQLQNLRMQHELSAAQLRSAQFNRSFARITASADGVVLYRLAEVHELIAAGQPVLVVSSGTRGYVLRAAVADRELLPLRLNLAAAVSLDAAPGTELGGHISLLSRAADPATGLFPVEITLQPTPLRIASGMIASARLQPGSGATLVRIPAGALVTAEGMRGMVFVLQDGRARRRAIEIAFTDGAEIAVRSGLGRGETVITDGAPYLDDNEPVALAAP
ncbi:MAG: efflux RND transporter periplasmic adaptor subunit [Steroidobacteraceae bacterium]